MSLLIPGLPSLLCALGTSHFPSSPRRRRRRNHPPVFSPPPCRSRRPFFPSTHDSRSLLDIEGPAVFSSPFSHGLKTSAQGRSFRCSNPNNPATHPASLPSHRPPGEDPHQARTKRRPRSPHHPATHRRWRSRHRQFRRLRPLEGSFSYYHLLGPRRPPQFGWRP